MATFSQLREQYPVFRFTSYDLRETEDTLEMEFHFKIDDLATFSPRWSFRKSRQFPLRVEGNTTLHTMAFSLGMVELISYWKLTCSPRVEIEAGTLDDAQIAWWKRLYFHGLGEFFYRNGIEPDQDTFMDLHPCGMKPQGRRGVYKHMNGCLIPVGGGKDSVVTLELLREQMDSNFCYIINPRGATLQTAHIAGYADDRILAVSRTLDPRMLELNGQGFLNGHTPFSALVAFSGLITAYLHRLQYVVLSNESSANESTVAGSTVNHQYSKSFAFEQDFHAYEQQYIGSGILYFSLLRPLSEYQIAGLFAGMIQYHRAFRSCNVGSKQDIWCCHCPKCLFVFLILSPFLPRQYLAEVFGKDMLEDEALLPIFEQLVGLRPEKPFECVGSRDEANMAAVRTIQALELDDEPLPKILQQYKTTQLYAEYAAAPDVYTYYFDHDNLLPPAFEELVSRKCIRR